MIFDSWDNILRVPLVGIFAYVGTVILLRVSGNRTLSKMNSFDLVVTIAFGSTLSTVLINGNVSLAEGLMAIALLVCLQFILTWLSVRSHSIAKLIKTKPTLLLRDGVPDREALRVARVTEDEIRSSVRQHGLGSLDQVAAVVLETDGSLSVISAQQQGKLDVLNGVSGGSVKPSSD